MSEGTSQSQSPWWERFFDDEYAAYGISDFESEPVMQAVDFLWRTLELTEGSVVLDQCCGVGRLSLPLAARGAHVIGVDFTASYVQTARRRAEKANLPCEFHHADAHEFATPQPCDAALNWYTSFGYDEDDDRNILMLRRVLESLKDGGRFAIDYMCIPNVMASFRAAHVLRTKLEDPPGLIVVMEPKPDFARGMMDATWTHFHADGRRTEKTVGTRMYMPHELMALIRRAGFIDVQLFGGVDGAPMERTSPRCVISARKPG